MPPNNKKKILIIDDDNFLLDMYALKFSQGNFEVHTATSGKLGLEQLSGGLNPDIMLIDIMMPEMDGFEFLEKINAGHIAVSSKKIILSNRGEQPDIDRAKGLGIAGYIVKANSTPSEVITQVIDIISR